MGVQEAIHGTSSKLRKFIIGAGTILVMIACSLLLSESASAHGSVEGSRAELCATGENVNCGRVMYEPFSVEGRGDFPEFGIPDGQIASGGKFFELDEQSQTRWTKVDLQGGDYTFHWKIVANHSTNTWDYYITRKGWDPNSPLKREDLELFCRYIDDGAIPPNDVYHECSIPNDREGYYVIVAVWDIADTPNAFYQVIDANLTRDPSAPEVPEPGFPGDPNRFGEYLIWNSIRIYNEGEVVFHNGLFWEALWWTQGQEPGTTGQWGPWRLIGETPPE